MERFPLRVVGLAVALVAAGATGAAAQEVRPPPTKIDKMPHAAKGIDPVAEFARGVIALSAKDYEGARQALERATKGAPEHYDAWGFLGAARAGLGDWAGSKIAYEEVIRLEPTSAHGHAGRALALAALKETAEAESEVRWLEERLKECGAKCTDRVLLQTMIPQVRGVLAGTAAPAPMADLGDARVLPVELRQPRAAA